MSRAWLSAWLNIRGMTATPCGERCMVSRCEHCRRPSHKPAHSRKDDKIMQPDDPLAGLPVSTQAPTATPSCSWILLLLILILCDTRSVDWKYIQQCCYQPLTGS